MLTASSAQLAILRDRLENERQQIEKRLYDNEHYGLASSLRDATGELSPIDNHPGDLATELYERGKDIALLEQEELHLNRIQAALNAMNDGTYGSCAACNKAIPYERLEAVPDTIYCIDHSPRQHVSDRRPAEEDYSSAAIRPNEHRMSMTALMASMAKTLGKSLNNGVMLIRQPCPRIVMRSIMSILALKRTRMKAMSNRSRAFLRQILRAAIYPSFAIENITITWITAKAIIAWSRKNHNQSIRIIPMKRYCSIVFPFKLNLNNSHNIGDVITDDWQIQRS